MLHGNPSYNVNRPYQIDGLNRVTQSGTLAIGHDARGNLDSAGAGAGATTYGYDGLNQLTTVSGGWSASLGLR